MTTALLLALSLLQAEPATQTPHSATPTAANAPTATAPSPAPEQMATPAAAPAPAPSAGAAQAVVAPAPPSPAPESLAAAPPANVPPGEPAVGPKPVAAEPNVAAPAESPAAPATTEPPAAVAATPDASPPPAPPAPAAPIAAAAPDGALAAPATVAAATPCPAVPECECARPKAPTHWGMTIDAGFPDMAGIGILYRPWYWLRLEAAGTTTVYASNGYRVGLSLVPFDFPLTPSLTVNYGRALEADWNKALAKFGQPNADLEPVLRKFGYQYVDAHVGLELGAPRRFIFFVRAGLTQIWTQLHGLTDAAAAQLTKGSATISDTSVTARVPSVKLGFLIYFF